MTSIATLTSGENGANSLIDINANFVALNAGKTETGAVTTSGLTMSTGKMLGRATAATGAIEEIPVTGSGSAVLATAPQISTIELGHASDTTLSRVSAGVIAIEGANILVNGGALGTPSSGTLTNATGLPIAGLTASTSTALGVGSIELGAATDTTISRVSAGVIAVEGVTVATSSNTLTLTNKRITPRILSAASYTTDTGTSLNCDNLDEFIVTAQAGALKLLNTTSGAGTGTPTDGQVLFVAVTGTAARALTYDTQFEASTVALPTTTVTTACLNMIFRWAAERSKWIILGAV